MRVTYKINDQNGGFYIESKYDIEPLIQEIQQSQTLQKAKFGYTNPPIEIFEVENDSDILNFELKTSISIRLKSLESVVV